MPNAAIQIECGREAAMGVLGSCRRGERVEQAVQSVAGRQGVGAAADDGKGLGGEKGGEYEINEC